MGYIEAFLKNIKLAKTTCIDYTELIVVTIVCVSLLVAYYLYIDNQVKMIKDKPEKTNKITVRILAAGFTLAYAAMQIPTAKETLDFHVYSLSVELYSLTKAIIFLGMIGFGLVTGGTFLSNIKGNGRNGS